MARKNNLTNSNFDVDFEALNAQTEIEAILRAEAKAIGDAEEKAKKKKTHVSVLLEQEDFDYIRDLCFERRISKNKFFTAALKAYRRGDWGL